MRCSNEYNDCFCELLPMAIMISSNNGKALLTTSAWPVVIGSNEPGKTAIFFMNAYLYSSNIVQEKDFSDYYGFLKVIIE